MTPEHERLLTRGLRLFRSTEDQRVDLVSAKALAGLADAVEAALAEIDRLRKAVAAHDAWRARGGFTDRELASIDRFDAAVRDARDGALEEVAAEADRIAGLAMTAGGCASKLASDGLMLIAQFARLRKTSPADRLVDEVRRWGT